MDKIICIGKNYLKHALELGDAVPEEALYFLKPPSALASLKPGRNVALPFDRGEIHHELELVLKIARQNGAWTYPEFTFGLDLTLRDLQTRLKKAGQPWEKAKVFENAAIVGPWFPCASVSEVLAMTFTLKVNGQTRQTGVGRDMRFPPDFLLKDVPKWFPLRDGDLLFTGTPEGVGPLHPGDLIEISGGPVSYAFGLEHGEDG